MAEHLIYREDARENLLSCATFLAETISSADGHAEALSQIVPLYIEKGRVDLAAQLADSVDDPFVRDRLLMNVAEKCAALDDDEYAFQLIEAIEDHGTQSMARERVALQKSAKDETEKALEIVENLSHPDNAFADIALHQLMKNDEISALQTIEKINFPSSKTNALQNIAVHYLRNGDSEKTAEFLELSVRAAQEIEYQEEKIRAFSDLAARFVEIGKKERGIELYENARIFAERIDGFHRDALFAGLSLGFLRAGDLEAADRTLDLVADKTQVASTLLGFSQVFWNEGEEIEAVETLGEAYAILKSQRDNEIRDSRARFAHLATIAVQFAKYEKPERAIEIAQENIDEMQQLSALSQIAQVCAGQGKDEISRQALNEIFEDSTRMFTLIGISDAKNASNDREKALESLNEAATLCETVPQLASRSEAYNAFAARYLEHGDAEKARSFLTKNLQIIAEIRSETNRSVNLAKLATLYEKYDFTLSDQDKAILKEMIRKAEIF